MSYAIMVIVQGNKKSDLKKAVNFICKHDDIFEGVSYSMKIED
jgi:hypothetical protein